LNHILNFVDHNDVLRLGFGCKDPNVIPCMLAIQKTKIEFEWDKFKELKITIESLVEKILSKSYTVKNEDIKRHWPKLYSLIRRNEFVKNNRNKHEVLTSWIQARVPPDSNSNIKFFSEKSYFI